MSINSSQEINRETGATLVDSSYIDSLLCTPDFLRSCTQYENLRFDLDKVLLLYVLRSTRSVTFFPLRILKTECFVLESPSIVKETGSLQESPCEKYF